MKTARRTLITIGALAMTYALIGARTDADVKGGVLVFLIGVLIAHDGVLLPVIVGMGVLVARLTPLRLRTIVRSASVVSLAVTVVAFPLVLGRGRAADNPSVLPLHYGRGLLEIFAVIWASAAVATAIRACRDRRARQPAPGDPAR